MAYHSELKDGYLEIVISGTPTPEEMYAGTTRNQPWMEQLRSSGYVPVLTDLTGIKRVPPETFKAAAEIMHNTQPYDKSALLISNNHLLEDLVNTIIQMFADKNKMQVFDNRQEALEWLGVKETNAS